MLSNDDSIVTYQTTEPSTSSSRPLTVKRDTLAQRFFHTVNLSRPSLPRTADYLSDVPLVRTRFLRLAALLLTVVVGSALAVESFGLAPLLRGSLIACCVVALLGQSIVFLRLNRCPLCGGRLWTCQAIATKSDFDLYPATRWRRVMRWVDESSRHADIVVKTAECRRCERFSYLSLEPPRSA